MARGLRWLVAQQDAETGLLGWKAGDRYLYSHAIATLALTEAAVASRSAIPEEVLRKAVDLAQRARNAFRAWRYEFPPNGENDTSVTGWMVLALKAAEETGVAIDGRALDAALVWFDEATDPETGRCGYRAKGESAFRLPGFEKRFPPDRTEALTADALACRFLLGQTPETHPTLRLEVDLLRRCLPVWEATPRRCLVDEVYWHFGTRALFHAGGEDWEAWNFAMKKALLEHQRPEGHARGSWDPEGPWGADGGRVYMTALCALCLEVYYRPARIPAGR